MLFFFSLSYYPFFSYSKSKVVDIVTSKAWDGIDLPIMKKNEKIGKFCRIYTKFQRFSKIMISNKLTPLVQNYS